MRRDAPASGFTLIELLVVIAIIVALLAILLPSMNRAMDAAKRVVCASNLGQVSTAFLTYAADNRAALPDTSSKNGYREHFLWMWNRQTTDLLLKQYLGGQALDNASQTANVNRVTNTTRVLICPLMEPDVSDAIVFARWNIADSGAYYPFNQQIFGSSYLSTTSSKLGEPDTGKSTEFNSSTLLRRGDRAYARNLTERSTKVLLVDALYHQNTAIQSTWVWSLDRRGHPRSGPGVSGSGYSAQGANQAHVDGSAIWHDFRQIVNGKTDWYGVQDEARVYHTFPGASPRGYYWYDPALR